MTPKRRSLTVAAVISAGAIALTGCSVGGATSTAASDGSLDLYGHTVVLDQTLADQVPEAMKTKGTIVVSTDAAGPPRSFVDENGTIVGVMPDLMAAVGATLGLKIDIQKNSFDAEVPGVQSGRFDSTTGTGDFPARREVLDLVDYMQAGYLYLVAPGNPKNVTNDQLSQCGLIVGVLKGTTQEKLVGDLSAKCVAEGKPAIDLQSFNNVLLEVPLAAGRIDVAWENTSTGAQVAAESPDKFAIAGDPIFSAYLAFGIDKTNTAYRDVLQKTLQKLVDDGTYAAILENWNQDTLGMDYISMNSDVRG